MSDLAKLIVKYRLKCFCFKYDKERLFQATANFLKDHNNEIIKGNNHEFQAFFHFFNTFNATLKDNPWLVKYKALLFVDRNLYGRNEPEEFILPPDQPIGKMAFVSSKDVHLLALPDFFGYIFRKSKLSINRVQHGSTDLETSLLTINSFATILEIQRAELIIYLDIDRHLNKF